MKNKKIRKSKNDSERGSVKPFSTNNNSNFLKKNSTLCVRLVTKFYLTFHRFSRKLWKDLDKRTDSIKRATKKKKNKKKLPCHFTIGARHSVEKSINCWPAKLVR